MTEIVWNEPQPVDIPQAFADAVGGHPVVAQTLWRRGIQTIEAAQRFLNPNVYEPSSPFELPDMEKAVQRIRRAIADKESICIWGDFDVDGQTSTTLLVSVLKSLDAQVNYYLPHREKEGHGVFIPSLSRLIDEGASLIVTCDTGISAHEAVTFANSRGVDVIITDHHQLAETLPDAYAVLNPQRLNADHPLFTLPGVGCAYKLAEALTSTDQAYDYLDLVALGIVADVAVLTGDARYLVQLGLGALRNTKRRGLKLMLAQAKINPIEITEETIGFQIAPRLNAVSRLDDANLAVELLLADDPTQAQILVNRLEGLNAQRKLLTEQIYQAAEAQIQQDPTLLNDAVLMLSHEKWMGSILGIVASRLAEQYQRPTILLTTPPGEIARGSARSIEGVDITAAIAAHADLLEKFGGHTMAAGLSIQPERIPELRHKLSRTVKTMLETAEIVPSLKIDEFIPLADVTPKLMNSLQRLAPFGPGNPPLMFASPHLTLKSSRTIGDRGQHVRLSVEDEAATSREVVWWSADESKIPRGRFDLAFTLHWNTYQKKQEVQMQLVDLRLVEEEPLTFSQRTHVEIVDYRSMDDATMLFLAKKVKDAVIWAEAEAEIEGKSRLDLYPAPSLIIWTTPPGATELRAALEKVNPATIYLFCVNPRTDAVQAFLNRLTGLVKFAMSRQNSKTRLSALAAEMSHRQDTIIAGLQWLEARGHISYVSLNDEDEIHLLPGHGEAGDNLTETTTVLSTLLRETAAYRGYLRRVDNEHLLK